MTDLVRPVIGGTIGTLVAVPVSLMFHRAFMPSPPVGMIASLIIGGIGALAGMVVAVRADSRG